MKDATFQKNINLLAAVKSRYLKNLKVCEDEYERRFGFHPSDRDDDFWIDFAHTCNTEGVDPPSVKELTENALICKSMARTEE